MSREWGYGLHEAMDQTGATLGPLLVSVVLYFKDSYANGFALLGIPTLLTMTLDCIAPKLYPNPQDLEVKLNIPQFIPFSTRF